MDKMTPAGAWRGWEPPDEPTFPSAAELRLLENLGSGAYAIKRKFPGYRDPEDDEAWQEAQ